MQMGFDCKDILPKDILPKDTLPKDNLSNAHHLTNAHFADKRT
jgi:hypothetical protein